MGLIGRLVDAVRDEARWVRDAWRFLHELKEQTLETALRGAPDGGVPIDRQGPPGSDVVADATATSRSATSSRTPARYIGLWSNEEIDNQ